MRYTYTDHVVPRGVPTCIYEGWTDRKLYGLPVADPLYAAPVWKRLGWRLGWALAAVLAPPPRPTNPTEPPPTTGKDVPT